MNTSKPKGRNLRAYISPPWVPLAFRVT
jgi:hypothetical protein